jgi:hypothetical protein
MVRIKMTKSAWKMNIANFDNREKNWEEKIMARRNQELHQLKITFLLEVGFNLLWQGLVFVLND